MRHCTLFLDDIKTKEDLHLRLKGALMLPSYYGMNLDALKDCLTDMMEDIEIVLCGFDSLKENLGAYADGLKAVLEDAHEEDEHISYILK